MKKVKCFYLLVLVSIMITGCMSDEDVEESLRGEWVEVQPVLDRTVLIFSSENQMSRIDGEGNEERYNYSIDGDSIYLSLPNGQEGRTALYFDKQDPMRFRIGNLYPSIPENDETYMVFERF